MLFQIIHLVLRLIDNAYISSQQPWIKLNENVSNQKKGPMTFPIFNGYTIHNIKKVWSCVISKINGKKKIRANHSKYKQQV